MKVDKATIARTVILVLALLNVILERFGIKALPIDDELVNQIVSVGFLLYSVITNWWHNNSFTKEAKQADEYMKALKGAK